MQYGKTLARSINCAKSLAKHALQNPEAKKWLLIGFGKLLKYEVRNLCSDKANSILKSKSKENVTKFPWKVLEECISHCPSLTSLIFSCTKLKPNQSHPVSVVVCLLAKFHGSNMSLLQRLVSLILYAATLGVQYVNFIITRYYDRLQKLMQELYLQSYLFTWRKP